MSDMLIDLIERGKFAEIKDSIAEMNVVDIAQLFEEISKNNILVVFRLLPKEIAAEVFTYLSSEQQRYIIESITDREIKTIIDDLFLDDTVALIEEMPANVVKRVLQSTSEDKRKLINQFLNYPENSAGSVMTIEYVDLKKEMTVRKALEDIKRTGVDKETVDVCYVLDRNRKLEGLIPLRKLILSDDDELIGDLMDTSFVSVRTSEDQEDVSGLFKKYDLSAMPVVDNEDRLVGIITIDDVVDIIEQENTEDFQKMAAMVPSETEYLKSNVLNLARHRIVWLFVLMISATFTGYIIRSFSDVLESSVLLAAFIPMLMDTGGNAGSQSATLVIRGLALDEIRLRDILKVMWKELRVSLLVGIGLGVVNFLRIYFLEGTDLNVALTVCISLFFTVVLAKVVGGALPIIAKKIRLDPAIMASPIITTIVDAVALVLYFMLATWLIGL